MKPVQRPLAGILTIPFAVTLLLFSLMTGKYIAFTIFILGLAGLSCGYAFLSRFQVALSVQAPSRIMEGDKLDLDFIISAKGILPRFIGKSVVEVYEPQSHHHKPAVFRRHKWWKQGKKRYMQLFFRLRPHADNLSEEVYEMDGFLLTRGKARIQRRLEIGKRGIMRISTLTLYFTDPLGMLDIPKKFVLEHEILVRVRPPEGSSLAPFPGGGGQLDTQIKVGETGEVSEFAGTRLYREGDELRHIHWPTVARTGELYVREYTRNTSDSLAILLLRDPEAEGRPEYYQPVGGEFIIRSATAVVIEFFNRRIHTSFGTNIGEGGGFSIGYSPHSLQRFHDYISSIDWEYSCASLDTLHNVIPPECQDTGVMIFSVDPPRAGLFQPLPEILRIAPHRFLVIAAEESLQSGNAEVPADMHLISCSKNEPEKLFPQLHI